MFSFKSIYFVLFYLVLNNANGQISDKRLCYDEKCSVPISYAKTLLSYSSPDARILSFLSNEEVKIYSKSAGSDASLWGAEIRGKRGYVPKMHVREYRVLKKPTHLVDTELVVKDVPKIEPKSVKEEFEVVDGTTIYLNPADINPSSTEELLHSTVAPNSSINNVQTEEKVNENPIPEDKQKEETPQAEDNDKKEASTEEKTVVDNVLDTLNNMMGGEKTSEEEFDDEEDDDDEFDEDDDETEGDESNEEEDVKPETVTDNKITEEPSKIEKTLNITNVSNETLDHFKPTEPLTNMFENNLNIASYSANLQEPILKTDTTNNTNVEVQPPNVAAPELNVEVPKEPTEENKVIDAFEEIKTDTPEIKIEAPEIHLETPEVKIEPPEEIKEIKEEADSKSDKNVQLIEDVVPKEEILQGPLVENSKEVISEQPHVEEETKQEKVVEKEPLPPVVPAPFPATDSPDAFNEFVTPEPKNYNTEPIDEVLSDVEEQKPLREVKIEENPATTQYNFFGNNEVKTEQQSHSETVTSTEAATATDSLTEAATEAPTGSLFGSFFGGSSEAVETSTKEPDNQEPSKSVEEVTKRDAILDIITEAVIDSNKPGEEDTSPIFVDKILEADFKTEDGLFTKMYEFFSPSREEDSEVPLLPELSEGLLPSKNVDNESNDSRYFSFNGDVLIYLTTTAVSVIIFLFGYIAMDKSKRETPLIAKINKLEKQLLITMKEKEILEEQGCLVGTPVPIVDTGEIEALNRQIAELLNDKSLLEEQIQALEKELDTSTEVGMELNRIVSEMLNSTNGSETLKANVEHLQRQLLEQQDTINTINETLSLKETENVELHLELDINNKKILGLQTELDKTTEKLLKIEDERDLQQSSLEGEITLYQQKHKEALNQIEALQVEIQQQKSLLTESTRNAELKAKEYNMLKSSLDQIKGFKNDKETLKSILDVTTTKAELQQFKSENEQLAIKLSHEEVAQINLKKQIESVKEECDRLRNKYEAADKEKLEINTKLDVLNNYFKEKESQLQKEISRYESIWATKEGEATSTTERIKYIQEELQNYKAQNETLKQEIVNQEVELKSQISVLEKKIHENWVTARQTERKLEDAKQEAAQLRNRLTLRERTLTEDKTHNRLQSPMEMNGDHPLSPPPLQNPASPPPMLYYSRDHMTKSPPIPGLPFLPPPPGAPFMPPPPGMHNAFMPPPPPPNLFPDRRPPPLGRMSSPPPRYTPDSTVYSGYDRNSPSPPYDSEYGTSPPPPNMRAYSPYNSRREYNRHAHKTNGRNAKGSGLSSGSDQSHESSGKPNRKQHSKV
ncbi:unnamed protein product [Brassicogethes aeneus]|uniref:SH3 domain-containing protein n=1 Tax=Brassicogethes aeneus TaxID=1431903 RepID=A0A9P0B469_BRAAE|nr:unnamed protein product [Brassicogethes aeneus]